MPPLPLILVCALSQAAATAPEAGVEPMRRATALFALVALSLGVLLLAVVLMLLARRIQRRQQGKAGKPAGVLVDPWSEAARRVQPFDNQDRKEGSRE